MLKVIALIRRILHQLSDITGSPFIWAAHLTLGEEVEEVCLNEICWKGQDVINKYLPWRLHSDNMSLLLPSHRENFLGPKQRCQEEPKVQVLIDP